MRIKFIVVFELVDRTLCIQLLEIHAFVWYNYSAVAL